MVWGLPRCVWARESTAPAQGNQSLSRELRASALCPGLEARFPARRREERGCGPVTGKDRASCQSGGAPALRPGAIAQSPGREAALAWASLAQRFPASSVLAREGAGCGSVGDVPGAWLASAPLWLSFGPRSQASLQKAQGPGVCKLPKPPASRALCQAKRALLEKTLESPLDCKEI